MSILDSDLDSRIKPCCGIYSLRDKDTSFAIVAVRCNSTKSVGKRKLIPEKIYYLLEGYSMDGDAPVTSERRNLNNLYDDYMSTDADTQPHIQISAIVGQNGSGKSSLIEFIMRLINNFAATTFGESKFGHSTERLHFIPGVQGDLWYIADRQLYQLHVENSQVALYRCGPTSEVLFNNGEDRRTPGPTRILERIEDHKLKEIFGRFFYTLISNHSLYAYNANDFQQECDTEKKEQRVSDSEERFTVEQRCWLHGLFHKNDGYQAPMVITPFRSEGNININTENHLVRERLISLLVHHESFRKINEHLTAYSLSYGVHPCTTGYGIDRIKADLGMNELTDEGYTRLRTYITLSWGEAVGIDLENFRDKPFYNLAIEYLVYKTLKIAYTYRQHHKNFKLLINVKDRFPLEPVDKIVSSLTEDFSHITRKIYQTLAYLIYDVYSAEIQDETQWTEITFDRIQKRCQVHSELQQSSDVPSSKIKAQVARQALIVPPFLRSKLNLQETSDENIKIDFETLSSGEKQQIYTLSSLVYHIDNLNSVHDDASASDRIPYRNLFLVLEEVELYFHPELQQQFIKYLLDSIRRMEFSHIVGIHILFVTHSPYVLSDIPRENILALTKEGQPTDRKLKSFGGNIHEMLKDSFFLSRGSRGYFAQWEIGHLAACVDIHRRYKASASDSNPEHWQTFVNKIAQDETDLYRFAHRYIRVITDKPRAYYEFSYKDFCWDFSEEKLRQRIAIIDEPIVRNSLLRELTGVFAKSKKEQIQDKIKELEQEIQRLEKECCD